MLVMRGDVVLVAVPHSSGQPGKIRPALVVQSDRNNQRVQDTIVALITTTTRRAQLEPTQFLIEVASPAGQQSGLLHDSAVKCERLHTLLQSQVQRKIGSLPATTMQRINDCLKASLEIA